MDDRRDSGWTRGTSYQNSITSLNIIHTDIAKDSYKKNYDRIGPRTWIKDTVNGKIAIE